MRIEFWLSTGCEYRRGFTQNSYSQKLRRRRYSTRILDPLHYDVDARTPLTSMSLTAPPIYRGEAPQAILDGWGIPLETDSARA